MNSQPENNVVSMRSPSSIIEEMDFAALLKKFRNTTDLKTKTREGWKDRQGNMHMVDYVEWHEVADKLDELFPRWCHAVKQIIEIGGTVAVVASITIGEVTREGVGTGTAENETGIKKAESDALKRAAIKFGIARDLYQKGEGAVIERNGAPRPNGQPAQPRKKGDSDGATDKQIGAIRAICRQNNFNPDEILSHLWPQEADLHDEDLTRRAASWLIDQLKNELEKIREEGDLVNNAQTESNFESSPAQTPAKNPAPPSDQGWLTESQKRAIENIAKAKGKDPQAIAANEFGCRVEELTEDQAARVISLLQD